MRIRALIPLALASFCAAQQTASNTAPNADKPAATLKLDAREVILPVTVRDKHGALVSTLNAGDFSLTQDGRPQTIKSFSRQTDLPYKLGLLVDTSRSLSGAMETERKAAGKFVDTMLPDKTSSDKTSPDKTSPDKPASASPNSSPDEAFLIHFDREVELLQDFTASRDKLHHELDDMGPSSRSRDDRNGPETADDDRDHTHGRGGTQLYDAIFLAASEVMKPNGRNAIVVFSDGVDRGSKDTLNDAIDAADKANAVIYTIYFKGEQEHNFSFPGGHHGGYPGGGGGYPGPRPGSGNPGGDDKKTLADGKKIMEEIARRTGGRFFEAKSAGHLDEIYDQIAQELRGQYLLTYTPDQVDKEGGYHKIALKANKDDLAVSTREGYYAPEEK